MFSYICSLCCILTCLDLLFTVVFWAALVLLLHCVLNCFSDLFNSLQFVFVFLQGSVVTSGGIDAGTGFTILSEKKLFLGQKVRSF